MDITQLILDDHHEQRRLFAMLEQIDRADTGVLSALWGRLASFLELHAAAEEEFFYPALLQVGSARNNSARHNSASHNQAVPGAGTTGGTMASIRCGPGSA